MGQIDKAQDEVYVDVPILTWKENLKAEGKKRKARRTETNLEGTYLNSARPSTAQAVRQEEKRNTA